MCYCKISQEDREKMRSEMLKAVNNFCDKVKPEEEDQVHRGIEELEISINEAALDTVFAHCENKQHTVAKALPSTSCVNEEPPGPGAGLRGQSANKQESTPLLPDQQQELRNRVRSRVRLVHEDAGFPGQKPGLERDSELDPEQEGSHNQSPGAQQPGESFCKEVLSLFQEMLSQLQKTWQDVLACLQMCASLVNMKSILSEIMNFCSSVAQSFSSLLQVQGVA